MLRIQITLIDHAETRHDLGVLNFLTQPATGDYMQVVYEGELIETRIVACCHFSHSTLSPEAVHLHVLVALSDHAFALLRIGA